MKDKFGPLSTGPTVGTGVGLILILAAILGLALATGERAGTRQQVSEILARARALKADGDYDEARADLRAILHRQPGHLGARRELVNLELELDRIEHVYLELQTLTEMHPDDSKGWLDMAELLWSAGSREVAEQKAARALDSDPKRADAHKLRAKIRYRLRRYYSASLDAEAALKDDPADVSMWLLLSQSTARVEGADAGLNAIKRAAAAAGDHPSLGRQKARLLAQGRRDGDRQSMKQPKPARATAPPPTVEEEFGASAIRPSEQWLGQLALIRQQLARYVIGKNWTQARLLVDAARTSYPDTIFGPWLASLAAYAQGHLNNAEANLREGLAIAPRSALAVTALARVWTQEHGVLYAGNHLMRLAERDPSFAYPRVLAARAYLTSRDPGRAEAALRRGPKLQPSSPGPYGDLATFYLELDRPADALEISEQGLEHFPDAVNLKLAAADASTLIGNRDRAIDLYEAALAARPDLHSPAANLARLLVSDGQSNRSSARALRIVRRLEFDVPSDPLVLDAIGWVHFVNGAFRRARGFLKIAAQRGGDEPVIHYHLGALYARIREPDLARRELLAALKSGKPFIERVDAERLWAQIGPPRWPRQRR
jgi:tetratricopeptide (TPR) repeat protein